MALGVRELLEIKSTDSHKIPIVVVGFDGIAEVRRRIDEGDQWLLNTVDVKVREQVERVVLALEEGFRTRSRPLQGFAITGEIFHGPVAQRGHVERIRSGRQGTAKP